MSKIVIFLLALLLCNAATGPTFPDKNESKWRELYGYTITFYTPFKRCNGKWSGMVVHNKTMTAYTSKGINIAAVDPEIIPLYSKIEWCGIEFLAVDVGGKIKGKKTDVLVPVYCNENLAYFLAENLGKKENQTICIKKP